MSDNARIRQAIEVVIAHLTEGWIEEGCAGDAMFGCVSCQAVRLRDDLQGLLHALDEDEGTSEPH